MHVSQCTGVYLYITKTRWEVKPPEVSKNRIFSLKAAKVIIRHPVWLHLIMRDWYLIYIYPVFDWSYIKFTLSEMLVSILVVLPDMFEMFSTPLESSWVWNDCHSWSWSCMFFPMTVFRINNVWVCMLCKNKVRYLFTVNSNSFISNYSGSYQPKSILAGSPGLQSVWKNPAWGISELKWAVVRKSQLMDTVSPREPLLLYQQML